MAKNTVGSGRNARTMKKAPWWVSGRGVVTTNCVIILVFAKMIANLLTWGVTKLIGMAYFWFQRISNHTVHSLSIGFRRLDCSTGQYALFILFYKKGVDGFYPSTPNIIEPKFAVHDRNR